VTLLILYKQNNLVTQIGLLKFKVIKYSTEAQTVILYCCTLCFTLLLHVNKYLVNEFFKEN